MSPSPRFSKHQHLDMLMINATAEAVEVEMEVVP